MAKTTLGKTTLGKFPGDAFGMLELPAPPHDVLDGYRALPDLSRARWRVSGITPR
jgi:hypothetical protein